MLAQLLTVAAYVHEYATYPWVPGRDPAYPPGWWGWADQSHYLRSMSALVHGNFDASDHFYPPLYAALGAPFYLVSELHPYFVPNLLILMWFAYVFISVATRYVAGWTSVLLLAVSVLFNEYIRVAFVVPWTSESTVASFATLIWLLLRASDRRREGKPVGAKFALVFGLAAGLLLLGRPLDAVATIPFALALIVVATTAQEPVSIREQLTALRSQPTLRIVGGLVVGYVMCLAAFVAFNLAVFGSWRGAYGDVVATIGYKIGIAPRQAFSLVLDSDSFYGQHDAAMVDHYPWLLLTLVGVVICLFRREGVLRTITIVALFQVSLYMPYVDFSPDGLWRFGNIHYYKWMFPYLALLAWLGVVWSIRAMRGAEEGAERRRTVAALCAVGCIALLMPDAVVDRQTRRTEVRTAAVTYGTPPTAGTRISIRFRPASVDLIDIRCVYGGWAGVVASDSVIQVDGRTLEDSDVRLIGMAGGVVRLKFTEHTTASRVRLTVGPSLRVDRCVDAQLKTAHLDARFPPVLVARASDWVE